MFHYFFEIPHFSLRIYRIDNHDKKISEDVALSTGSACSAGEPSYVIQALGLADKVTKVLRVSINKYTTAKDIEEFVGMEESKKESGREKEKWKKDVRKIQRFAI